MQPKLLAFADEGEVAELARVQYRRQEVVGWCHDDEDLGRRGKIGRCKVE